MSNLQYRTETDRVAIPETHPIVSGDPFRPRTEAERVLEAERFGNADEISPIGGLMRNPETGHLVGIEPAPYVPLANAGDEYPRWITPHASHVVFAHPSGYRPEEGDFETEKEIDGMEPKAPETKLNEKDGNLLVPRGSVVSVPNFQHSIRRHDGAISVLVNNEEEEKLAQGERSDDAPAATGLVFSAAERRDAERIYWQEQNAKQAEGKEERLAEIINDRRKQALDDAERALDARRQQLAEVKAADVSAEPVVSDVPTHAVESPEGIPLGHPLLSPEGNPTVRQPAENPK